MASSGARIAFRQALSSSSRWSRTASRSSRENASKRLGPCGAGDGRNDIEMLRWARRGVAVGQATQDVVDAADAVTAPAEDDGVALELARWFG
jgi:hypothetical protein